MTELLGWLLEYHRRDAKPLWWRFFERQTLSELELHADADCLAGVTRTARAPWPEKKSTVYEYAFDPEQDTHCYAGSAVSSAMASPAPRSTRWTWPTVD
ncbi:MAG: hypothetical protein IPN47_27960 [Gemmatimonadetes bacterium]|nr:hypothetical protein [Gemmatimonadota bacterium]